MSSSIISFSWSLPLNPLYKSLSNPSINQEKGSHVSQVKERQGEDSFDPSSLLQNPPCQDNDLPFLPDFESRNLGDVLNAINFLNQIDVFDNLHSLDSSSVIVCKDHFLSAPFDLSVSQENFVSKYLDLEYNSIKEDVLIETSSSPHYHWYSTFCKVLTYDGDTLSHELDFEFRHGGEIIHDE